MDNLPSRYVDAVKELIQFKGATLLCLPYRLFNLGYRKFGRLTPATNRLVMMSVIGRIERKWAYRLELGWGLAKILREGLWRLQIKRAGHSKGACLSNENATLTTQMPPQNIKNPARLMGEVSEKNAHISDFFSLFVPFLLFWPTLRFVILETCVLAGQKWN